MNDFVQFLLQIGVLGGSGIASVWLLAFVDIFTTFVPEGQIKVVMKGEDFNHFIVNVKGKVFRQDAKDDVGKNFSPGSNDPVHACYDLVPGTPEKSTLTELTGAYWVGPWPVYNILKYNFSWNQWAKKEGKTEYEVVPRQEPVPSIFFRYPYAIEYHKAEISGNERVYILSLITIETVNPYIQMFVLQPPGRWLDAATGLIREAIKKYAAARKFEELLSDKMKDSESTFEIEMKAINKELRKTCGVQIVNAYLQSIDLTEPNSDFRKAILAKEIAERRGDADIMAAEKFKTAETLRGEGRAASLRFEMEAMAEMPQGVILRQLEALEKSKIQVLGAGAMAMVGLNPIKDESPPSPDGGDSLPPPAAPPSSAPPAPLSPPPRPFKAKGPKVQKVKVRRREKP